MNKTHATWEKRNLGLNSLEIQFNHNDMIDIESFNEEIKEYDYVVAKLPNREIKLIHELENIGFRFMETQLSLIKSLNNPNNSSTYFKKLSEKIKVLPINSLDELSPLLRELDNCVFETDRISLDPYLGIKQANNRYKYWITDEFSSYNSNTYQLYFKDERIGFFILKNSDPDKTFILLGGLYGKYKNSGLGFSILQKSIEIAQENNKEIIETKISSNNLAILKLYLNYGFTINGIEYVLRKFNG